MGKMDLVVHQGRNQEFQERFQYSCASNHAISEVESFSTILAQKYKGIEKGILASGILNWQPLGFPSSLDRTESEMGFWATRKQLSYAPIHI